LTKIINLHTEAALHEGHSDLAAQDFALTLKLDEGVRHEPLIVSGLVAAGMFAIELTSFWDGLRHHDWTDAQLAALQNDFSQIDWLSDYQLCMRGEAIGFYAPTFDYMRDHREARSLLYGMSAPDDKTSTESTISRFFGTFLPKGWFDLAKAHGVSFFYRGAREPIDPIARRVYPKKTEQLKEELNAIQAPNFIDLLVKIAGGPILNSMPPLAEAQFRTDAAQIACALERYRLANRAYPPSLDGLSNYVPHSLPHDPLTGQSYIYRLRPDGTYLLYSVGWNMKDDGGTVVPKPGGKALDREQGDWVWPCPDSRPLVQTP
jgi:hypothetical protein